MGIPVHDADAAVHRLIGPGGAAAEAIEAAFPGTSVNGAIDRRRLGDQVFQDPAARARLEAILHPLVRRGTEDFLKHQARQRRDLAVLDIPLLFETGGGSLCDAVIVVSAPSSLQAARVLGRPGMTEEKYRAVLAAQMSDAEKRRLADFVVLTGLSKGATLRQLTRIVTLLRVGGWKPNDRKGPRKGSIWNRHA